MQYGRIRGAAFLITILNYLKKINIKNFNLQKDMIVVRTRKKT